MNAQNIVLSIPQLTLEWQFAVGDETVYRVVQGESHNPLYVLLNNPTSELYLTSVHTACAAAHTKTNEEDVFTEIWAKFESLLIHKAVFQDGTVFETDVLKYYGREITNQSSPQYTTIVNELAIESINDIIQPPVQFPTIARDQSDLYDDTPPVQSLLKHKDGKCSVWQEFMISVLGTQGITAFADSIVVKEYDIQNDNHVFKIKTNLHGQGGSTPMESIWAGHAVVSYAGQIYDPSYGKEYGPKNGSALKPPALNTFVAESVESFGTTEDRD
ncbi:MAG: hypothetical protein J6X44_12615, partial [Thermoguttaceae bacterium]|nr:hypothetical protein [Thermoguttaceae bacterium]